MKQNQNAGCKTGSHTDVKPDYSARIIGALTLLIALLLAMVSQAHAAPVAVTVTLDAQQDAYVNDDDPAQNHDGQQLQVAATKRSFVSFDLSVIPAGATIVEAKLHLNVVDVAGDMPQNLS
ncbi:MAG: hypothetical protein HC802_13640, partial [Caldilineaceae bacterium]|nr:hypothetical protein [Caldilineaceae bacterium]